MNRPGLARPSRNALWRAISQSVQKIQIWNFNTMWILVFRKKVFNFEIKIVIGFGIILFSLNHIFCLFFPTFFIITQDPLNIFRIWLFHMKEDQKEIQNYFSFYLIRNFYKVNKWIFWPNRPIFTRLVLQIGSGRAKLGLSKQFKVDYRFSAKK